MEFQFALAALDRDIAGVDRNGDALGIDTGCFPTRDIIFFLKTLEYGAKYFAADIGLARIEIRHHTLGGGEDGDTQPLWNFGRSEIAS